MWISWKCLPRSIHRCSSREKVRGFHLIVSSVCDPKIKQRASVLHECRPHRSWGCLWELCQAFSVELGLFLTACFSVHMIQGPGSGRHVLAQLEVQLTFSKDLLFLAGHSDRCIRPVEAPLKSCSCLRLWKTNPHSWSSDILQPYLLRHRRQTRRCHSILQAYSIQLGLSSDSLGCRSYA